MPDLPDPPEFLFRQHGRWQFQHRAVLRISGKQVAVVPDVNAAVRLDFFPQRVDRRIRHLGKPLFEVVKQRRMRLRKHRQRFVRAHGNDGLRPVLRHRPQYVLNVLPCIVEGFLQFFQFFLSGGRLPLRALRQIMQPDQVPHPFGIRMLLRVARLDLAALRKLSGPKVRLQHVPGLQLPSPNDVRVLFKKHPRL